MHRQHRGICGHPITSPFMHLGPAVHHICASSGCLLFCPRGPLSLGDFGAVVSSPSASPG